MSRPIAFDGQPLLLVENVTGITDPPPIVWLNVEVSFFGSHIYFCISVHKFVCVHVHTRAYLTE